MINNNEINFGKVNIESDFKGINYIDLDAIAEEARNRTNKFAVFDDIKKPDNNLKDNNENIVFQISDWNTFHEESEDGKKKFYTIRLFGRAKDKRTITVFVNKFTPYFYVKIPDHWRVNMIEALMLYVKNKIWPKENADGLLNYQVVNKYDFYYFSNYTKYNFL